MSWSSSWEAGKRGEKKRREREEGAVADCAAAGGCGTGAGRGCGCGWFLAFGCAIWGLFAVHRLCDLGDDGWLDCGWLEDLTEFENNIYDNNNNNNIFCIFYALCL